MSKLTNSAIKHLLVNLGDLNALAVYAYNESNEIYMKITSQMTQRLKRKFDVNYEILKHKELSQEEITQAYQKIKSLLLNLHIEEDYEEEGFENENETDDEISPIEHYLSFYFGMELKRYKGFNPMLDELVNESSLERVSAVEVLIKVMMIAKEAKAYETQADYMNYQLPRLIKKEQNALFVSVFELLYSVSSNSTFNSNIEKRFEQICLEYKQQQLAHYTQLKSLLQKFIQTISSDKKSQQCEASRPNVMHLCLDSYSKEEFEAVLNYYAYKINSEGKLSIEDEIEEEKCVFLKEFLDNEVLAGIKPSELEKILEAKLSDMMMQFEKKVAILQWGLKEYLARCTGEVFKNSNHYCKLQLKMLFDPEIREELFSFIEQY